MFLSSFFIGIKMNPCLHPELYNKMTQAKCHGEINAEKFWMCDAYFSSESIYEGKSISKLQMDIELKQTRVLI
jgi:hypothetical protein